MLDSFSISRLGSWDSHCWKSAQSAGVPWSNQDLEVDQTWTGMGRWRGHFLLPSPLFKTL